jgi:hypothetical protein
LFLFFSHPSDQRFVATTYPYYGPACVQVTIADQFPASFYPPAAPTAGYRWPLRPNTWMGAPAGDKRAGLISPCLTYKSQRIGWERYHHKIYNTRRLKLALDAFVKVAK